MLQGFICLTVVSPFDDLKGTGYRSPVHQEKGSQSVTVTMHRPARRLQASGCQIFTRSENGFNVAGIGMKL